jgi:hypothetical protein
MNATVAVRETKAKRARIGEGNDIDCVRYKCRSPFELHLMEGPEACEAVSRLHLHLLRGLMCQYVLNRQ